VAKDVCCNYVEICVHMNGPNFTFDSSVRIHRGKDGRIITLDFQMWRSLTLTDDLWEMFDTSEKVKVETPHGTVSGLISSVKTERDWTTFRIMNEE